MRKLYYWALIILIIALSINTLYLFNQINNLRSSNSSLFSKYSDQVYTLQNKNQQLESELNNLKEDKANKPKLLKNYYAVLSEDLNVNIDTNGMMYYPKQKLDRDYNFEQSFSTIQSIKAYLESFRKLTETVGNQITKEQQDSIGNLDWSIQNIAFANFPNMILINVNELKYIIKKLDFELSIKEFETGSLKLEELNRKRDVYIQTKKEFEEFANHTYFAD